MKRTKGRSERIEAKQQKIAWLGIAAFVHKTKVVGETSKLVITLGEYYNVTYELNNLQIVDRETHKSEKPFISFKKKRRKFYVRIILFLTRRIYRRATELYKDHGYYMTKRGKGYLVKLI